MKKDVRDMAGNRYAEGSLHDVVFALDGVPRSWAPGTCPSVETNGSPRSPARTLIGFSAEIETKSRGAGARNRQETTERTNMIFRRPLAVVFGALLASTLVACGGGGGQGGSGDGSVNVVATYSILGNLVENVGGEDVELTTLVGPNGDAHTFEPAPSDNANLAEADVVFENGLEFETWLDDLYGSSGSEAERVVVTEDVETLPIAEEEHGHEEEEEGAHEEEHADEHAKEEEGHEDEHAGEEHAGEEEHGDEHGEFDPHVW
ncbi:MAG: zinc ABC transporter substrate-binding protein, partial [Actinomycetota bacterium]|nr:zinc ABC transporter substrate-binding protein [Actinomycetota bacterium]